MAVPKALIDSSFLYAIFDRENPSYELAVAVAQIEPYRPIIPYVVLTEAAFLFHRSGGTRAVAALLRQLRTYECEYVGITQEDFSRVAAIAEQYEDAKLDFVDCVIMTLSETLNIRTVCTFDYRDFTIFRPSHCDALEILP